MPGEGGHRRSFTFSFVLIVISALSTVYLIRPEDAAFAGFSLAYIVFLDKHIFPPNSPSPEPPVFSPNRAFVVYISAAGVIGLVLPSAYVFHATYLARDSDVAAAAVAAAAAPPLFLLSCQVLVESVSSVSSFSLPVRAFVPVLFNSRRLFAISDWLRHEFRRDNAAVVPAWTSKVGKWLAVLNMALWSFNLFGFLLPVYLPKVLRRYYGRKESTPAD